MAISVESTPNPNALKFTVGAPVGGPATFTGGQPVGDPTAAALLAIDGVSSVFLTADFVTVTKSPEGDWEAIAPAALEILESRFG